ncbi:DUF6789 family protein [Rubrobacter aplysinae]|uniref:DUF6789 family protein n=1 Tax=Rubrobacter aplysinae TaxID=909625 RepID=UPI0019108210|nr:DUF6789 family protein [Rubrobacter aplysinae]
MTSRTSTRQQEQRQSSSMAQGRLARGFGWGVVATLAMSVLMIVATATGLSPMPMPVPAAIVGQVLGGNLPQPLIVLVAALSHLAFGGVAGAVLAALTRPITLLKGLGWGILLWVLMGVVFLPFVGWGLFGTSIAPQIAVATLVLHLVYGTTLGLLLDRGKSGE